MLKVQKQRLEKNLKALGAIGYTDGQGTSRISYSETFLAGREFVQKLMEDAGLTTRIDSVGNLIGLLSPKESDGKKRKKIALGSHIDTVPCGGMYDGVYGVLAAIECVKTMVEQGYQNRHPIEIFAFIDEEGAAVGGTFGSKCVIGVPLEQGLKDKMQEYGIDEEKVAAARILQEEYGAYYELHIEQGGVLEKEGLQIGVTDGIVGITRYEIKVFGTANHAGTTPMELREDPMARACQLILELMEETKKYPGMVCTVGRIHAHPGTYNIIPDVVDFSLDMRFKESQPIYEIIERMGCKYGSQVEIEKYIDQPPTYCDNRLQQLTEQSMKDLGITGRRMYSGAGHDMINMAFAMPSALIFIPSKAGISHHIKEYSSPEDMAAGADVLLQNIIKLDEEGFTDED